MATYTVELRKIVESGINVFNFPYAFYDESKREEFERHFIEHFYFREIGAETVDRFRWYLKDKMNTVFPYYNELFNAAQIEYNILDNYNIKEEHTIERENLEKGNMVSSDVGRSFDKQSSETDETRNGETSSTSNGEGNRTDTETIDNDTTGKSTEQGTKNNTVNVSTDSEKNGTVNVVGNTDDTKRYLETPQGKLDLRENDYLTNLTQNDGNSTSDTTNAETGSVTEDRTENGAHSNTINTEGTNDTERNLTSKTTQTDTTTGTDKQEGKTATSFEGERTATNDNNTRTERIGSQVEKMTFTKRGNIGVDTDADMIQKHINLQKVLRNIEKMFFDECEDLFMLVY